MRIGILCVVPLLLASAIAEARITKAFKIDEAVADCEVIAVARVLRVADKRPVLYKQFGQTFKLKEQAITVEVLVPLKGKMAKDERFGFRHRVARSGDMQVDGWMGYQFREGTIYLLFLMRERDGRLELPAPETFFHARFPALLVPKLAKAARQKYVIDRVVDVLLARFEYGPAPDNMGLACLNQAALSGFGHDRLQEEARRKRYLKRLLPLVNRVESEMHWGVLRARRNLGDPVAIEKVTGWILNDTYKSVTRLNLIGQLSRYEPKPQLEALRRIRKESKDPEIRLGAASQIPHAEARVRNARR